MTRFQTLKRSRFALLVEVKEAMAVFDIISISTFTNHYDSTFGSIIMFDFTLTFSYRDKIFAKRVKKKVESFG